MNKIYRIQLTPIEPYFFGSDKTFRYGEEDKERIGMASYFIRSEEAPSQTTLFGVLRYLGIRRKRTDYRLDENGLDAANIGGASFKYDRQDQTFGRIKKISPLYIADDKGALYVRTPMDHKTEDEEQYRPFRLSEGIVKTSCGDRIFPEKGEYDPKSGITDSYMDIHSGKILDQIYESFSKAGIRLESENEKKAFFKMEYKRLKKGLSFTFFAELEDGFFENDQCTDRTVYMGSRKSTFSVAVSRAEAFPEWKLTDPGLPKGLQKVYLESDCLIDANGMNVIQEKMYFGINGYTTAREYTTNYTSTNQKDRFRKTDQLYRLLKAGSIYIFKEEDTQTIREIFQNVHYETVGYNNIKVAGGEQ
jgi:CRISPR type III-B/RAMP module-associated protein Cmr3